MNYLYTMYIGANNTTKQLDTDLIHEYLSYNIEGYTFTTGEGFYKGNAEACAIISILGDANARYQLQLVKTKLLEILKQESILLTVSMIEEL